METDAKPSLSRSIRRHLLISIGLVVLLTAGFLGWAANARLAGAVVASGVVVVEGNVKQVQHREGGIVGDILVRDGDRVEQGDLVVRLDDTLTKANLAIVQKQIDELMAREMRLSAERDNAGTLSIPEAFRVRLDDPAVRRLLLAERALFEARKTTLRGQKQQLKEQVSQIQQEILGLSARHGAKKDELDWIEQELSGVLFLYEKDLIPFPRIASLHRQNAQIEGDRGQLTAEIARAKTRIAEIELQTLQLDRDHLTEVLTELREVTGQLAELVERRVAAEDELRRGDIRAPQSGIVHELTVHTVGGVVGAGDVLMLIVPSRESLLIEARLQPADIDQVHSDQPVVLRFSAFNQRTTPELFGTVRTVSADRTQNPNTGEAWYTARIDVPEEEIRQLGGLPLIPGMPVEAFIRTEERTALSYLLKPLSDQIERAFREE